MANEHRKRCSTSSALREMQTKTMRYHCTPAEWLKEIMLTVSNAGENATKPTSLKHC
jgi:hypothetical protein